MFILDGKVLLPDVPFTHNRRTVPQFIILGLGTKYSLDFECL